MANDDLLSGLGDSSFDDILRPVAPPAPSALERLSGILGNTIGLPKKGADALANAVADYIIGPGQHMSEGEMLKEAALPEDTSDHSYARTLGRAGIQTLGDIATDPLVQATMGAGAIANPINAATLAQAGKIPEALEAAKNASVAAGALKALNPAFTASMALGAAETVPPALKGLATQGLNPDTAAQLLQAGINVGGLAMGAKGTYQDFREPVQGPAAMLQDGLHQLVGQGKMPQAQADEIMAKYQQPDLMKQEAQQEVAQRPVAQPQQPTPETAAAPPEAAPAPEAQAVPETPPEAPPPAPELAPQTPTEAVTPEQPNAAQPVEAAPAPLAAEPVEAATPVEAAEPTPPPQPLAPPAQAQIVIPSEPPLEQLPPEMEQVLAQTIQPATPDIEPVVPAEPIRTALPEVAPEVPVATSTPPTEAPTKISIPEARQAIADLPDSQYKSFLLESEKTPHVLEIVVNSLREKGEFPKIQDIVNELKGRSQGMTQGRVGQIRKALANSGLLKEFNIESVEHLPKQGKRAAVREAEKAERNQARAAEQQRQATENPPPQPVRPAFDEAFKQKFGEDFDQSQPAHLAKAQALVDELLPEKQTARGIVRQQAEAKKAAAEPSVVETPPTAEEAQDISHRTASLLDVKQADPKEMIAHLSDPANTDELLKLADIVESRVRGFDQETYKGKDAQAKLAAAVVHEIQRESFDPHLQSRTRMEAQTTEQAQESPLAALPERGYSVSTTGGKPWDKTLAEARDIVKSALRGEAGYVEPGVANPAWIKDAVKVGYEYLRTGLQDAAQFGRKLVHEFGAKIEPYIRQIYNRASELYREFKGKTGFSFGELENEPQGETLGTLGGALQQVLNPRRLPKPKTTPENVAHAGETTPEELGKIKEELATRQGPLQEDVKPVPRTDKEVEGALNVQKASDDPVARQEAARLLSAAEDVYQRARGKARPVAEVKAKAAELGLTPEEALRMYRASNGTLNDAEMVEYKQLSRAAEKELVRTAERVRSLKEAGKDTDLADIAHQAALQQAIGINASYIAAGSEGARAFGVRRALVEAMNDGDYLMARVKRVFKSLTPEQESMIKTAIATGDKSQLIEAIRQANNPTAFKAFMEWWKSWGLLSGPPTHIANWIGNRLMREIKYWDQAAASGLDLLHSKLTGKERQIFTEEYGAMKFGAKSVKSMAAKRLISSLNDAIQGKAPSARELFEGSKIDNPGVVGGRAGEYNRIWFKFLEAADAYHKGIAGGEELYRQSYRMARKEGLKGAEAWDRMRNIADKYVEEEDAITAGELQGHTEQFYNMAQKVNWARQYYTFQDNLGKVGQGIQAVMQEYPALGFVFPFVKTPINIAKRTLEHTPLEAFKSYYKFRKGQLTHTQVTEQMAKAVVGTTIAGIVYSLANEGLVTGGGPTDPRMQQAKKESGWQPYSAKIGDQYLSYQRFEPLSSILGMAADASELMNSKDINGFGDAMEKVMGSITENLTSKTFLSGLEALSTALHDPRRYAGRFAKQLEASLVPNIVGKVAQATDPTFRKTQLGDLSPILAKIPGLSETLEPQRSPTGEERQRPGSAIERFASPVTRQSENQPLAALNTEFARIGFVPSLVKDYLSPMGKKVQLLPDEMLQLNQAQQKASQAATKVLQDPQYQRLPDNDESAPIGQRTTKAHVLEGIYNRYRKQAQDRIMPAVVRRMQEQYGGRR